MLDVNPETICRLILLAREFHSQDNVSISDEPVSLAEDMPIRILASHADDSTLGEFRSIVADLEPRQQQQVVGLLWIGRGDYGLDEWEMVRSQAQGQWHEYTADYLIAHPLLADCLIEGLELHGHRCD